LQFSRNGVIKQITSKLSYVVRFVLTLALETDLTKASKDPDDSIDSCLFKLVYVVECV